MESSLSEPQRNFQLQLSLIDKRLQRAREKRDNYLKLLKAKYPEWTSMELQAKRQEPMRYMQPTLLLDSLGTSRYHWDSMAKYRRMTQPSYLPQLRPNSPIPSGGPLLNGELASIKTRLNKIAEDLRELRSHRLHLSSAEFYATAGAPTPFASLQNENQERFTDLQNLRKLLEQIEPDTIPHVQEPKKEDLEAIKADELFKKYRESIQSSSQSTPATVEGLKAESDSSSVNSANNTRKFMTDSQRSVHFQTTREASTTSGGTSSNNNKQAVEGRQQDVREKISILSSDYQPDKKGADKETSSYQKLLDMIKQDSASNISDNDDFDPTFSKPTPSTSGPMTRLKYDEITSKKTVNPEVNSDFVTKFLGNTQASDSTDSDSTTSDQEKATPADKLESDSDFFG